MKKCVAKALVANDPLDIAKGEASKSRRRLNVATEDIAEEVPSSGPGNIAMIKITYGNVTELFTRFSGRGISRRRVAGQGAQQAQVHLGS